LKLVRMGGLEPSHVVSCHVYTRAV
jgi:hypothetical protein